MELDHMLKIVFDLRAFALRYVSQERNYAVNVCILFHVLLSPSQQSLCTVRGVIPVLN
jgi:hypothetical protein